MTFCSRKINAIPQKNPEYPEETFKYKRWSNQSRKTQRIFVRANYAYDNARNPIRNLVIARL